MYKHRKLHWWETIYWDAIPKMILYWLQDHPKAIRKFTKYFTAIVLVVFLAGTAPGVIHDTIASYADEIELRRNEKIRMEQEAKERELRYLEQVKQEEIRRREDAEYRKKKEEAEKQEKLELLKQEMKENGIVKGSWIQITWWNGKTGPDAPDGNSSTGQITKIVDDQIYGTWGEQVIVYDYDIFHTISKKQYLELRQDEQARRDRAERKKNKKFKSWGLYPGTVKN